MNEASLIGRNLFRKKLRTILMMVSIFVAFAIFGVLASFEQAFSSGGDPAAADRLVVFNKINFTQPLPLAYFDRVAAIDGVQSVTHSNWFGGYYQDPRNLVTAFAVEPKSYLEVYAGAIAVAPEQARAFIADRQGALVGEGLARKWGWKVGDRLPISSNIFAQKDGRRSWDVTIDGILKPAAPQIDTNFMVFQWDYFNETQSFRKDMIGWMGIRTTSPAANDRVSKSIDAMFANSSYETATDSENAFNKAFAAQFGNIALIVLLVVGAAFVTILMIVGNTMAMAIRERRREIGVLKTLGFPRGHILRMVLGESLALALLGGVPGIVFAGVAARLLRDSLSSLVHGLALTPTVAGTAFLLMIALGLISGAIPAINAMRLDIASALGRS